MKITCLNNSCLATYKHEIFNWGTRYMLIYVNICEYIWIYVKGYGFLSFAKNMGKNLSNKYGEKLVDSAKTSTTDAIKTGSKRAIQKTAEATDDLIVNKISDKIENI